MKKLILALILWPALAFGQAVSPIPPPVFSVPSSAVNAAGVTVKPITFAGGAQITSPADGVLTLTNNAGTSGVGLNMTTDGTLKIRTRAQTGDGNLSVGSVTSVGGFATTGIGVPIIVVNPRLTGQTASVASVATYTPAADGTFEVSANVLITTSTAYSFNVTVTWTDEGNTARTYLLLFSCLNNGALSTVTTTGGGAVPYNGYPFTLRAKAGTAITLATSGTFTTVTYNVEGLIKRIS